MKFLEKMERLLRSGIVYPFLRGLFKNPVSENPLDLAGVQRMLVFRFDRIGDTIVTLPILRALKRRSPHMRLTVLASKSNAELLQCCDAVDEVVTLERSWIKLPGQVLELRLMRFDVVMNFVFNQTTTPAILANVIAPNGVKVGQGPEKYGFYFNRLVKVPRFKRHMTEQLAVFVEETFGIRLSDAELQPGIDIPVEQQNSVDAWLRHNALTRRSKGDSTGLPYIVFNLSAGERERELSETQAGSVASDLGSSRAFRTVVVYAPQDDAAARMLATRQEFRSCIVFETQGTTPLAQLASLIGGAIAVVTPDTAVIHFASAMGTPVAGLYGEDYKGVEWGPFRVLHKIIRSEAERPVSTIPEADLKREIRSFVEAVLLEERAG